MPQAKTGGSEPGKPAAKRATTRSTAAKSAAARPAAKPAATKTASAKSAAKPAAAKTAAAKSATKSATKPTAARKPAAKRTTASRASASTAAPKRTSSAATRASTARQVADARVDAVAQRLRKLNERIIEVGRDAGESTLTNYERALKAIASGLEKTPAKDEAEWVAHLATSQAKFIRDLTDSWAKAARQRLK